MGKGGSQDVKETPHQKELAAIAAEKWQEYTSKYVPMENEFMRRVDDMNADWQYQTATGAANKTVQGEMSGIGAQVRDHQFQGGINPNSGRFKATSASLAAAEGEAAGQAMITGAQAQQDRHIGGLKNIVQIGQGQSVDAQRGLTDVARMSGAKEAERARGEYQSAADNRNIVGTAAGMTGSYALRNL